MNILLFCEEENISEEVACLKQNWVMQNGRKEGSYSTL